MLETPVLEKKGIYAKLLKRLCQSQERRISRCLLLFPSGHSDCCQVSGNEKVGEGSNCKMTPANVQEQLRDR